MRLLYIILRQGLPLLSMRSKGKVGHGNTIEVVSSMTIGDGKLLLEFFGDIVPYNVLWQNMLNCWSSLASRCIIFDRKSLVDGCFEDVLYKEAHSEKNLLLSK